MVRLITLVFYCFVFFMVSCQQQDNYETRGEEIFPPAQMKYVSLFRIDNLPVSPTFFQGQWTVVIFGESPCKGDCLKRLELINGVKDAKKLFVFAGLAKHTEMRELAGLYQNVAITMGITAATFDNFYRQFDADTIEPAHKHQQIYIVNPLTELVYSNPQQDLTADDLAKEIALLKNQEK